MAKHNPAEDLARQLKNKKKKSSISSFQEKFRKGFGGAKKVKKIRSKTTLQKLFGK